MSDNLARDARSTTGLSQKEFCEKFVFSIWTYRGWEQGRRKPDRHSRVYLQLIKHYPVLVSELVEQVCAEDQSGCPQADDPVDK